MKTNKIIHIVFYCIVALIGGMPIAHAQQQTVTPDNNENHVTTTYYKKPKTVAPVDPTTSEANQSVTYYDGFGRVAQEIGIAASPDGEDIVIPYTYNDIGQTDKQYLPYAVNTGNGAYQSNALTAQPDFYNLLKEDTKAHKEIRYDRSPIGRVTAESGFGTEWSIGSDNYKRYLQRLSSDKDKVIRWRINASGIPEADGLYSGINKLTIAVYKAERTDDYDHRTFTNQKGQVVLKRSGTKQTNYDHKKWRETYQVYDRFGNLRFVIPPNAVYNYWENQQLDIAQTYEFQYDKHHRLKAKKAPGKDWEYFIHDHYGRLILRQDGNMRKSNKWFFNKYDQLNRIIYNGIVQLADTYDQIWTRVNDRDQYLTRYETRNHQAPVAYTLDQTYPTVAANDVLEVFYYDSYWFDFATQPGFVFVSGDGVSRYQSTLPGIITGKQTRLLNNNGWLKQVTYYDEAGRAIQQRYDDHLGGNHQENYLYGFEGQLQETYGKHQVSDKEFIVRNSYGYDNQGRESYMEQELTCSNCNYQNPGYDYVILYQHEYNAIGERIKTRLHLPEGESQFAQEVDYRYNMQGWLTSINNAGRITDPKTNPSATENRDLFGMELLYNETDPVLNNFMLHDGKISGVKWSQAGATLVQGFKYAYDQFDMLEDAWYVKHQDNVTNYFGTNGLTYDHNGNITGFTRTSIMEDGRVNLIDDVNLTYAPDNTLADIQDHSEVEKGVSDKLFNGQIQYDANGNLISDPFQGIEEIQYNHLNLPIIIFGEFTEEGEDVERTLRQRHDAAGTKLREEIIERWPREDRFTTYDYIGNFVCLDGSPLYMHTPVGRVMLAGSAPEYQYNLTDHLGNVRVTFSGDPEQHTFVATMEDGNATEEEAIFQNIAETRTTFVGASHSPDKVAQLNRDHPVGPAITLAVMPGDDITLEAWAYYEQMQGASNSLSSDLMIAAIAGSFGGLQYAGEGGVPVQDLFSNIFSGLGFAGSDRDDVPAAFLNYLLFDKDMTLVDFGYQRVTDAAQFNQQRLAMEGIEIEEPGYLYVYVSNESNTGDRVFFDDLKVTQRQVTPVVQAQDYRPFGLTFNTYQKPGKTQNRHQFNGIENLSEFDPAISQAPYRTYDASIGRWWQQDPVDFYSWSQYNFSFNMPNLYTDPNGDCPPCNDVEFDEDDLQPDPPIISGGMMLEGVTVTGNIPLEGEYDIDGLPENDDIYGDPDFISPKAPRLDNGAFGVIKVDPRSFNFVSKVSSAKVKWAFVRDVTFGVMNKTRREGTVKFNIWVQIPTDVIVNFTTGETEWVHPRDMVRYSVEAAEWAYEQVWRNTGSFNKSAMQFDIKRQFVAYMQANLQQHVRGSRVTIGFNPAFRKYSRPMIVTYGGGFWNLFDGK